MVNLKFISLCFVFIGIFCVSGCAEMEKRNRFLIPENYVGWVCVSYGVEGASFLEIEDGFRLIKFDDSGIVETASDVIGGHGYLDEFWWYSPRGRVPLNLEKELGGGSNVYLLGAPKKYISGFWVSSDVRKIRPDETQRKRCDVDLLNRLKVKSNLLVE